MMNTSLINIAALLMIGAALSATPVFAADGATDGNKGLADKSGINRDAPLTLPGAINPKPTPTVDAASLSRGIFDTEPAKALDGLATLTLSRDGSVSETPASETLRGVFEDAIAGKKAGK
jgi:hypothetical protein